MTSYDEWTVEPISVLPNAHTQRERVRTFIETALNLEKDQCLTIPCPTLKDARNAMLRAYHRLTGASIKENFNVSYFSEDNSFKVYIKRIK